MMPTGFAILKGKDNEVRINTKYITAYTYDKELDETIIWLLGRQESIHYPGDQRREINMTITAYA